MTNAEKFKEVFGFELTRECCIAPDSYNCADSEFCDACRWDSQPDEEYSSTGEIDKSLYKGGYIENGPECNTECFSGMKLAKCWECGHIFQLENQITE